MVKVAFLCHLADSKNELSILNKLNISDSTVVDVSATSWNEKMIAKHADAFLVGRNTFRHLFLEANRMPMLENSH